MRQLGLAICCSMRTASLGGRRTGFAVDREVGVVAVPVEAVGRELDDACGGQGIEAEGADDAGLQREAVVVEAAAKLLVEFVTVQESAGQPVPLQRNGDLARQAAGDGPADERR
ncbi:hypothetical protein ACFW6E_46340 [Streptomyces olivaceoviridis]|uniref:hypothetical protein n=1 Tax=Streptomyces olivaceoviridis TaxID=1921 RepID=UPI0036855761